MREHEDPEAIAQIITEAIRRLDVHPGEFAAAAAPHASSFGFGRGDGLDWPPSAGFSTSQGPLSEIHGSLQPTPARNT
jgi:hypothetical protein